MNVPLWLFGLCLSAAVLFGAAFVWQRSHERRTMETLHRMLDAAIDGSFAQHTFDESLLSSVESKLNTYLTASEVSARNLAEEKDKIKQLIADISHQTKTPIANILLYAQLLAEQSLPDESAGCVRSLDAQAQKLSFLIAALVKLSRLEAGILVLRPTLCALAPVMEAAVAQCAPSAAAKGVALQLEPTAELAVCDAKWTQEALFNLLDNAVKYTPRGGSVSIRVQAYNLFCRIAVTDTGIGIAPEEHPKIFARFYRGMNTVGGGGYSGGNDTASGGNAESGGNTATHATAPEGVGIGLYLTRQILAEQGGYVKVASAPGHGAVFSAFLPRATPTGGKTC